MTGLYDVRKMRALDRHMEACAGCDRRPGCLDWQDHRRNDFAWALHAAELEHGWQPRRPWLVGHAEAHQRPQEQAEKERTR